MIFTALCSRCRVEEPQPNFLGMPIFNLQSTKLFVVCPFCASDENLHDANEYIAAWHAAYTTANVRNEYENEGINE